jgi:predicted nucleotidyltransferase
MVGLRRDPPTISPSRTEAAHNGGVTAPGVRTRRSDQLAALARVHRDQIALICARHGCRNPRIVGSVALGDADEHSDLDLMVDVDRGRSIFDLASAREELEELLGVSVDVLAGPSPSSANPAVARQMHQASIGL